MSIRPIKLPDECGGLKGILLPEPAATRGLHLAFAFEESCNHLGQLKLPDDWGGAGLPSSSDTELARVVPVADHGTAFLIGLKSTDRALLEAIFAAEAIATNKNKVNGTMRIHNGSWSVSHLPDKKGWEAWVEKTAKLLRFKFSQPQLALAIAQSDACAIDEAIKRGADPNKLLITGEWPMVKAIMAKSTAAIAALRGHEISEEQWRAAANAAAGTDLEGMVKAKDEPVPKPKGT